MGRGGGETTARRDGSGGTLGDLSTSHAFPVSPTPSAHTVSADLLLRLLAPLPASSLSVHPPCYHYPAVSLYACDLASAVMAVKSTRKRPSVIPTTDSGEDDEKSGFSPTEDTASLLHSLPPVIPPPTSSTRTIAVRVALSLALSCVCIAIANHFHLLKAFSAVSSPTSLSPSTFLSPSPSPPPSPPPSASTSTSTSAIRVLLVMADNRPLQSTGTVDTLDEVTSAAYLNYQYTRLHPGMSFRYYQYGSLSPYLLSRSPRLSTQSKHLPSCYNAHLDQLRAAPWCKLQAAWAALQDADVDVVFFIDSDAVIANYHLSPLTFLTTQPTNPHWCSAASFLTSTSPCSLLLFANLPWEPTWPNTGAWLIKRSPHATALLQFWWHFNHSTRNFYHAYEQDTLHMATYQQEKQWERGEGVDQFIHMAGEPFPHVMGMVNATSMRRLSDDQYVLHYTSPDKSERIPAFHGLIRQMGEDDTLGIERDVGKVLREMAGGEGGVGGVVVKLDGGKDLITGDGRLVNGAGKDVDLSHWVEVWTGKLRPV